MNPEDGQQYQFQTNTDNFHGYQPYCLHPPEPEYRFDGSGSGKSLEQHNMHQNSNQNTGSIRWNGTQMVTQHDVLPYIENTNFGSNNQSFINGENLSRANLVLPNSEIIGNARSEQAQFSTRNGQNGQESNKFGTAHQNKDDSFRWVLSPSHLATLSPSYYVTFASSIAPIPEDLETFKTLIAENNDNYGSKEARHQEKRTEIPLPPSDSIEKPQKKAKQTKHSAKQKELMTEFRNSNPGLLTMKLYKEASLRIGLTPRQIKNYIYNENRKQQQEISNDEITTNDQSIGSRSSPGETVVVSLGSNSATSRFKKSYLSRGKKFNPDLSSKLEEEYCLYKNNSNTPPYEANSENKSKIPRYRRIAQKLNLTNTQVKSWFSKKRIKENATKVKQHDTLGDNGLYPENRLAL